MSQSAGSIYEIRWREVCPWLILVSALRVTLLPWAPWAITLAWLGVFVTEWGWVSIAGLFSSDAGQLLPRSLSPLSIAAPLGADQHLGTWVQQFFANHPSGPLVEGWQWMSHPFVTMFRLDASFGDVLLMFLCGMWAVAVWAVTGGAIARFAARYLIVGKTSAIKLALRDATSKWAAILGAPLIGMFLAGLVCFPLFLVGLFLRMSDLFAMAGGMLWVFWLVWGLVLAAVVVPLWIGWPFAWATIAVERSDSFDAVSRTAAYVYQRPLHLVFYVLIASAMGLLGQFVLDAFVAAGVALTDWAVSWGAGYQRMALLVGSSANQTNPTELSGSVAIGIRAIQFWKSALYGIAGAYPMAYLWSACVAIYLLMRLQIDGTELDEFAVSETEAVAAAANFH